VILGNSKKFKGTGYVCYIDVLGFSNDILNNWNNPTSNPLEKILAIKKEIPVLSEVGEDDGKETHRTYVCRVNSVSDSVTICFGYNDDIIIGDLVLGLLSVIGSISYIWSKCISEGYTIRGAIDFGEIYWDENELIGPAFINAYRLESEVSKNSRVLVSSNLNKIFANLVRKYKSPLTDDLFERFRKDVDGYLIVNPNVLYQSHSERDSLINSLKKIRDAAPSGIVRKKYNPLISMLSNNTTGGLSDNDIGNY